MIGSVQGISSIGIQIWKWNGESWRRVIWDILKGVDTSIVKTKFTNQSFYLDLVSFEIYKRVLNTTLPTIDLTKTLKKFHLVFIFANFGGLQKYHKSKTKMWFLRRTSLKTTSSVEKKCASKCWLTMSTCWRINQCDQRTICDKLRKQNNAAVGLVPRSWTGWACFCLIGRNLGTHFA